MRKNVQNLKNGLRKELQSSIVEANSSKLADFLFTKIFSSCNNYKAVIELGRINKTRTGPVETRNDASFFQAFKAIEFLIDSQVK